MTTYDLTRDQLDQLKQDFVFDAFRNDGKCCSYMSLACSSDVPDAIIHDYYEGMDFTDDDFTC